MAGPDMTRRLLSLGLLAMLAGCGRKGDLRLPENSAAGEAVTPQAPEPPAAQDDQGEEPGS